MAIDLHMALVQTFHAQKNQTRPGMKKIGLSPGQPKVLMYLSSHDGCMQKEIAHALDIDPATVSQILNNMEQEGLIERTAAPQRKRAECVVITEKGKEAFVLWIKLCKEVEDISMQGFTKQEREQFMDYLFRMYFNLTQRKLE